MFDGHSLSLNCHLLFDAHKHCTLKINLSVSSQTKCPSTQQISQPPYVLLFLWTELLCFLLLPDPSSGFPTFINLSPFCHVPSRALWNHPWFFISPFLKRNRIILLLYFRTMSYLCFSKLMFMTCPWPRSSIHSW